MELLPCYCKHIFIQLCHISDWILIGLWCDNPWPTNLIWIKARNWIALFIYKHYPYDFSVATLLKQDLEISQIRLKWTDRCVIKPQDLKVTKSSFHQWILQREMFKGFSGNKEQVNLFWESTASFLFYDKCWTVTIWGYSPCGGVFHLLCGVKYILSCFGKNGAHIMFHQGWYRLNPFPIIECGETRVFI